MRVGLVCPEMPGHVNPTLTLGRALTARGHAVTLVGFPSAEAATARAGLEFAAIGWPEHCSGRTATIFRRLAGMTGYGALLQTGILLRHVARIGLRDLPPLFRSHRLDGVVVDQVFPAGGTAADLLGLPHCVSCCALTMHQEPAIPPATTGHPFERGWRARVRNGLSNLSLIPTVYGLYSPIFHFRRAHRLPRLKDVVSQSQGLAQVAQQPAFFDFPRKRLPDHFHPTRPWHVATRDERVPFPWDRLDGRPLVYASLGTLQNRQRPLFDAILEGAAGLPVQLVLSFGRADAAWDGPVPSNAIVVPYAPQLPLLDRAVAVVTHSGLNTTLEALARGKPMVCVPITNDQPGVAARVARLGAGLVVPPKRLTAGAVHEALTRLTTDESYRSAAESCREKTESSPDVHHAAAVIELALSTGKRVVRRDRLP